MRSDIKLWGDGVNDDTVAIQYLLDHPNASVLPDWFPACACGRSVFPGEDECHECLTGKPLPAEPITIPAGTYKISSALIISGHTTLISGCHFQMSGTGPFVVVKPEAQNFTMVNCVLRHEK